MAGGRLRRMFGRAKPPERTAEPARPAPPTPPPPPRRPAPPPTPDVTAPSGGRPPSYPGSFEDSAGASMEFAELYRANNGSVDPVTLMEDVRTGTIRNGNEKVIYHRAPRNLRRYYATNDESILDETIAMVRNALVTLPRSSDRGPGFHHQLSLCLWARFLARKEDAVVLAEAAEAAATAVDGTGGSHPERPDFLDHLCLVLAAVSEATGSPEAALGAEQAGTEALRLTPADSAQWAERAFHLGLALIQRYEATDDLVALDHGIDRLWAALVGEGDTAQEAAINLAQALARRHDVTGGRDDLDQGIELVRTELAHLLYEGGRQHVESILAGLLMSRYESSGDTADMDEALRLYRSSTPPTPGER